MVRVLIMMCLLALGSAACATTGAVPRPFPGGPVARKAPAAPDTPDASASAPGESEADRRDKPDIPIGKEASASPPSMGRALAEFALGFRGVPYRLGGADPAGFDCSGLVQYVFAQYGIDVPRIVEEQYGVGDKIKPSEIKPGDLLFFNTKRRGDDASHVAIAIGGDGFVHAPNSTGVVRVEALSSTYWGSRYLGARRIAPPAISHRD
jgi:cell wall-associated NlpC family hydrolase